VIPHLANAPRERKGANVVVEVQNLLVWLQRGMEGGGPSANSEAYIIVGWLGSDLGLLIGPCSVFGVGLVRKKFIFFLSVCESLFFLTELQNRPNHLL
jgi:hypothetical protein